MINIGEMLLNMIEVKKMELRQPAFTDVKGDKLESTAYWF
jgi:hypothetical protein